MTKLISWNVNGLRACVGKNFLDFFHEADADVFCLQETKLQAGQIDLQLPGYHQYWNYAEKKGYSGTALFTKKEPLSVTYGIGVEAHDHEGRVITAAVFSSCAAAFRLASASCLALACCSRSAASSASRSSRASSSAISFFMR